MEYETNRNMLSKHMHLTLPQNFEKQGQKGSYLSSRITLDQESQPMQSTAFNSPIANASIQMSLKKSAAADTWSASPRAAGYLSQRITGPNDQMQSPERKESKISKDPTSPTSLQQLIRMKNHMEETGQAPDISRTKSSGVDMGRQRTSQVQSMHSNISSVLASNHRASSRDKQNSGVGPSAGSKTFSSFKKSESSASKRVHNVPALAKSSMPSHKLPSYHIIKNEDKSKQAQASIYQDIPLKTSEVADQADASCNAGPSESGSSQSRGSSLEAPASSGVPIGDYKRSQVTSQVHYYMDSAVPIGGSSNANGDTSLYSGGRPSSGRVAVSQQSGVLPSRRDNRFAKAPIPQSYGSDRKQAQSTAHQPRTQNPSDESRKTAGPPATSMAKSGSTMYGTAYNPTSMQSIRNGMSPIMNFRQEEESTSQLTRTSPKGEQPVKLAVTQSQAVVPSKKHSSNAYQLRQVARSTRDQSGSIKRRKRYNPNQDPNFDVNSPEYDNTARNQLQLAEFRAQQAATHEDAELSMEFAGEEDSNQDLEENGEVDLSHSEDDNRKVYSVIQKKEQPRSSKRQDQSKAQRDKGSGKSCQLMKGGAARKLGGRKALGSEPTTSQVGGGKAFRQSQVGGKPSHQSVLNSGIMSGIKGHSVANLSVIESGDEDESPSQDETSDQSTDQNKAIRKPLTPIDEKSKEVNSGEDGGKSRSKSVSLTSEESHQRQLQAPTREPGSSDSSECDAATLSCSSHSKSSERPDKVRRSQNFDVAGAEGSSASLESAHQRAKDNFIARLNGLSQTFGSLTGPGLSGIRSLRSHQNQYKDHLKLKAEELVARERGDVFAESELAAIYQKLKNTKLACVKYNHCLDGSLAQSNMSFQAHLMVEGELNDPVLRVINRLPKQTNLQYQLNTDPHEVNRERQAAQMRRSKLMRKSKRAELSAQRRLTETSKGARDSGQMDAFRGDQGSSSEEADDPNEAEVLHTELDEEVDEIEFADQASTATCRVSEIQGIIFGGMSSRFWMLRKHINSLDSESLKKLPFYSWNCLTLQLKRRDIDLVIKDEAAMDLFLKFLIYSLKTLDGSRGSALSVLDLMNKTSLKEHQESGQMISVSRQCQLAEENERKLFSKIHLKYKIMSARAKISFMALQKRMTVGELIANSILETYRYSVRHGYLKKDKKTKENERKVFHAILRGPNERLMKLVHDQLEQMENSKVVEQITKAAHVDRVEVIKNGKRKTVSLKEKNLEVLQRKIEAMASRDQCMDLFKDINLASGGNASGKQSGRVGESYTDFLHYKCAKTAAKLTHGRIKLLMDHRLIGGVIFLKAMLRRTELAKQLLILEVERGEEVLIPPELSQEKLPASFKYYDCILQVVQERVSAKKKEDYNLRKQAALQQHENTPLANLQRMLGLRPDAERDKMKVQYKTINEKTRKEIDYKSSTHAREIQRSRYLQIDDNLLDERQLRNETNLTGFKAPTDTDGILSATGLPERFYNHAAESTALNVKFLNPREVQDRRSAMLKTKQNFMLKQAHLKGLGQRQKLMSKVREWLENDIDKLCEDNQGLGKDVKFSRRMFSAGATQGRSGLQDLTMTQTFNVQELQKNKIQEVLLTKADKLVSGLVLDQRKKLIDQLKVQCKPGHKYEDKVEYVEGVIERDLKFFCHQPEEFIEQQKELKEKFKAAEKRRQRADRRKKSEQSQFTNSFRTETISPPKKKESSRFSPLPTPKTKNSQQIKVTADLEMPIPVMQQNGSQVTPAKRMSGTSQRQNSGVSQSMKSSSHNYWMQNHNGLDEISEMVDKEQNSSSTT